MSPSRGYKIFYSGAEGAAFAQTGIPQLPVEDVVLLKGWNWIGHAPLTSYDINTGITPVGSVSGEGLAFTVDDQIKTRSGRTFTFCTYDARRRNVSGRAPRARAWRRLHGEGRAGGHVPLHEVAAASAAATEAQPAVAASLAASASLALAAASLALAAPCPQQCSSGPERL